MTMNPNHDGLFPGVQLDERTNRIHAQEMNESLDDMVRVVSCNSCPIEFGEGSGRRNGWLAATSANLSIIRISNT